MSRQMQKTQKPARRPARHGDVRSRLVRVGACALAGVLAALMLLSVVFSALPIRAASQSAVDALRQELSQTSERKKEIEAELKDLSADKKALSAQIVKLDEQIATAEAEIELQEQLVAELGSQITEQEAALAQAQADQDEQYEKMKSRIRFMVENGSASYLNILLSAEDFAEFLSLYEIVSQVSTYEQELFEELRALSEQIAATKQQLEDSRAEQVEQLNSLEANKQQLDVERDNRSQRMKDLETAEEEVKEAFAEIEAEEDSINAEIKRMVAELASTTTYVGGTFSWPLPAGYTTITCPYEMRTHPITGDYKLHTGVDLRAGTGTKIFAANGGTVIKSTYSAAYGNYVVINHGGGVSTLYAHMNKRAVSKGDTVSQGDVIGYVGSTGYSTGPHLHFEIIKNGSTIDPMTQFTKQ